jgi:hypothetical protein
MHLLLLLKKKEGERRGIFFSMYIFSTLSLVNFILFYFLIFYSCLVVIYPCFSFRWQAFFIIIFFCFILIPWLSDKKEKISCNFRKKSAILYWPIRLWDLEKELESN